MPQLPGGVASFGRGLTMTGGFKCALFGLLSLLAGCGGDAVRADLEEYARTVLAPVESAERDGARDLSAALNLIERGELSPADARRRYGTELAARYETLVRDLEVRRPATPELAELHRDLVAHYRLVARELDEAGRALGKSNRTAAEAAHARLAALPFSKLRPRLDALCQKHRVQLHDPER